MGQMQQKVGSVESVKSTIKSLEDNSQYSGTTDTLKQSIVQDTKNTGLSGEGCLGGSHKSWSGNK